MQFTIDLSTSLEQGTISSSGDTQNNDRVRTIGYFSCRVLNPTGVTLTATSTTGKIISVDFLGYASNSTTSPICDLYWYDSPHTFDLTSYSGIIYFRAVFKYSDGSTLPLNEIASCSITLTANDTWEIGSDSYPIPMDAPEIPESYMVKPYPAAYWRIEEGEEYPSNALMPDLPANGAFANASELTQASIPQSVKYIGREAFKNTKLKNVRIASDCTYYSTSFPMGCVVNFYPD